MAISWQTCDKCEQSFNTTYGYFICEECGNCLCDDCAEETGVRPLDEIEDEDDVYCPFCTKDEVTTEDLLEFALTKLNLTHEELLESYRQQGD